jgi:hypothetical protein
MSQEPPPETTSAQRARNVFGTLTTLPATKFLGDTTEQDAILQVLSDQCPSIIKLILQQEKHKEGDNKGNIHYHFLVCMATGIRQTKLQALRSSLSTWHPGRHDVQFAKSVKAVELYLFKEYSEHRPLTQGYSESEIASIEHLIDEKKPPPIMTANPNKYEARLLEEMREFFLANDFRINYYTRAIHGRNGKDRSPTDLRLLFEQLTRHTEIPQDYGMRGLELIEKHIKDPKSYLLPYYVPDRDYVSFTNAVYSFTKGLRYDVDDPLLANIAPIRHFDVDFPPPCPTSYLYLIKNHGWDRHGFIGKYGAMFKPKSHRDPCMYLWGPPLTGKSMFYIPLIEVLGDLVGNFTRDGKFSLSELPDKLLAILDEVDIWNCSDLAMDLVKKLLEGTEFTVARKNRDPGVVKAIHSFIATNTEPPSSINKEGNRNYHIEAIMSRIHPYETKDLDHRDENIIRSIAIDHAPGWAVYCTQSEQYITTPPEYV